MVAFSTSRISDLSTRLSGWFSHTFSSSSTDISSVPSFYLLHEGTPAERATITKTGPNDMSVVVWALGMFHLKPHGGRRRRKQAQSTCLASFGVCSFRILSSILLTNISIVFRFYLLQCEGTGKVTTTNTTMTTIGMNDMKS